jgi:hypothetical protein
MNEALAGALPLWNALLQVLAEVYGAAGELRFYGRNYGWALRFRKSGKALLSLYPGEGSFTAQVVVSPAQAEKAMALALGRKVRAVLETTHEYPEGRWLYIPVASEQDVQDIQQLLALKAKPARRRA